MDHLEDPGVTENDIIDCPYYLLTRASLSATSALRRELEAVGFARVRPAYLGVLMCLWREDGRKVGELGRCAGLEPSTMTGLLDRMARDGLLRRKADPEDRRAHRVFLTEEGLRAEEAIEVAVAEFLERLTAGISDGDVEQAKGFLRQILNNAQR